MTTREYIKRYYKLPFLKRGITVVAQGLTGTVVSFSKHAAYIGIRFKHSKPKRTHYYHPTWQMKYLDKDGNVLAEFKD